MSNRQRYELRATRYVHGQPDNRILPRASFASSGPACSMGVIVTHYTARGRQGYRVPESHGRASLAPRAVTEQSQNPRKYCVAFETTASWQAALPQRQMLLKTARSCTRLARW